LSRNCYKASNRRRKASALKLLFRSIHYLPTEDSDWFAAGILAQQLRAKGLTLPLTDVLIAVIAQRHAMKVLTLDKHFQHLPVEHFCGG